MNLIRLSRSDVGNEEKVAINKVIDKGYLGMGLEVKNFELDLKNFIKTKKDVICVSSGTSALHLSLSCLDIGTGDEVLIPSITYVASFQAISAAGAKPIACDVLKDSGFIDLEDAVKRITKNTKAIMPVHYASDSSYMKKVYKFAKENKLRVIEDAAHAFGCRRNNKFIGAEGDVICFSFDGIKNITSGEGGAVVTGDKVLSKRIRDSRLLGVENDTKARFNESRSWNFNVSMQGFRYHMSDLMAALGRQQLRKIKSFSNIRKRIAQRYLANLKDINGISFLDLNYENIVPHIFVIKVNHKIRDKLREHLKKNNIESGIHYLPNHLLNFYKTKYKLPVAENFSKEVLSLPIHTNLNKSDQFYVIETVKIFFEMIKE
ncbi:DegT/DnrJ/EryC1/StrS family aminotransferase [Methylophilaceae bacterium]|nr:DegT/DnrJ/EryC1/StrS family aminotransferase [Methylophilaceae bacterium]